MQSLQRPCHPVCSRPRLVRAKGLVVRADASARVRGDARRVHRWLSDVRHWNTFYPGEEKTYTALHEGTRLEPGTCCKQNRNAGPSMPYWPLAAISKGCRVHLKLVFLPCEHVRAAQGLWQLVNVLCQHTAVQVAVGGCTPDVGWPLSAGTKSAVKLGNALEPIRVGTKFETQRDMLGMKVAMT